MKRLLADLEHQNYAAMADRLDALAREISETNNISSKFSNFLKSAANEMRENLEIEDVQA